VIATVGLRARAQEASAAASGQVRRPHLLQPITRSAPPRDTTASESDDTFRTYAYLAGGLGVAGLGTFGVLGAMSYSDKCVDGRCSSKGSSMLGRGESLQRFANIGLAVGLAGAGAALTLWVLRPKTESSARLSLSLKMGSIQLKGRL
jgi:hypothetical protein